MRNLLIRSALRSGLFFAGFVFFSGCATPYTGRSPDLSLRGNQAEAEFNKFKLSEESWFTQGRFFRLSATGKAYTVQSMAPLIEEVSPEAGRSIRMADRWRTAQFVSLGLMAASFVGSLVSESDVGKVWLSLGVFTAGGVSIACGVISNTQLFRAEREYNSSLRSRLELGSTALSPSLRFAFQF